MSRPDLQARSLGNRRVREVLAIFEEAVRADGLEPDQRIAASVVAGIVDDCSPERFATPPWSASGLRALLTAFMQHSPAGDFEQMVANARKEREWLRRHFDDYEAEVIRGEPRGVRLGIRKDRKERKAS